MTISKFRSLLYGLAKYLGDFSALKSGDPKKIGRRIQNRLIGKLTGRLFR
jgi:hypothetical protein